MDRPSPLAEHARGAARGDRRALRALLLALAPRVYRDAHRVLGIRADAEDATQEALMAITRDIRSLRDPRAVERFAARITTRVALRLRARARRSDALAQELADQPGPQPHTDDAAFEARHVTDRLLRLVQGLPEEQAESLVLQYVFDYRPAEIAAAMGVPVNTVRSRVRLARQALARRLVALDPNRTTLTHRPSEEA